MRIGRSAASAVFAAVVGSMGPARAGHSLTLDQRLDAQAEIERVYYSHQTGATQTFEQAVPRSLLLKKVRTYLLESRLLETRWNRPLSYTDLTNEWRRIRESSQFPDRLAALEHALGDDPELILECFVRPVVADRLARESFSKDLRIHGAAYSKAEKIREHFTDTATDDSEARDAFVMDIVDGSIAGESVAGDGLRRITPNGIERRVVAPSEFAEWERRLVRAASGIGVEEDLDSFTVFRVLQRSEGSIRVGAHRVPKESWDVWIDQRLSDHELNALSTTSSARKEEAPIGSESGAAFSSAVPRTVDAEQWVATSMANAPTARFRQTAVWTGNVMIVWGGQLSSGYSNTGGRYDPLTDSWTPLSTLNAPIARADQTGVWTGQRLVVWGGGTTYPNVVNAPGGRYDPIANEWTAVTTVGQPAYRRNLVSVWTGTEMIIWGGVASGVTYPSGGGRYDPVADKWTLTTTVNAPLGTALLVSVWTGTEMIVWGGEYGQNPGDVRATGGRYNPSLDQWLPTSLVNAPSPRSYHSGIWTGSRMVVWGGFNWANYFATGAQYDPATDTWTPTSTVGTLSARGAEVEVWTGLEMIIWSGWDSVINHNDGVRYDPSRDTWTPITVVNAPSPRRLGTAVWTGSEMIAWGGYSPVATGGTYRFSDIDRDGFPLPADCNDGDPTVFPGAPQLCDGRNNDCSDPDWPTPSPSEADTDADGYRICAGDCDDNDPSVYDNAPELCDGKNNDCSASDWPTVPPSERDLDVDGYRQCSGDCDETDAHIHPGADEICNHVDDDCDGQEDEDVLGTDTDGDGVHNACDNCRMTYNPTQLDSDHDGVGNSCDNCAAVVNPNQPDVDGDSRGDACDNCPLDYNTNQDDLDGDSVGDACDNCLSVINTDQHDWDNDHEGDRCDLNDGLILITKVTRAKLDWQNETLFSSFNLYRGSLERLFTSGEYTQDEVVEPEAMRWCGLVSISQLDSHPPAAGRANFYLVTGRNSVGESSLGQRSDGSERSNHHPCP
jgi:hypothetical protein